MVSLKTFNTALMCVCMCISLNSCWLCTILGRKHLVMGGSMTLSVHCISPSDFTHPSSHRTWRFVEFTKLGTNETLQSSPSLSKSTAHTDNIRPYAIIQITDALKKTRLQQDGFTQVVSDFRTPQRQKKCIQKTQICPQLQETAGQSICDWFLTYKILHTHARHLSIQHSLKKGGPRALIWRIRLLLQANIAPTDS